MALAEFWKAAALIPRAALVLAALSAFVMIGTFFGLTVNGPGLVIYSVHLAVMALGLALFGRVAWHHVWSMRRPHIEHTPTLIPRFLKLLTVAAFAACLLLFITSFIAYGEGGPELREGQYTWVRQGTAIRTMTPEEYAAFEAGVLGVFAAAWLAFSLMIAWAGHVVDTRLRRLRARSALGT